MVCSNDNYCRSEASMVQPALATAKLCQRMSALDAYHSCAAPTPLCDSILFAGLIVEKEADSHQLGLWNRDVLLPGALRET